MEWIFEPGHTAAEFSVRHMMVTYVRGHFKTVHGTLRFDPDHPDAQDRAPRQLPGARMESWWGQPCESRSMQRQFCRIAPELQSWLKGILAPLNVVTNAR